MPEALQILSGRKKINDRFICITFDDGFRNNLTVAWPILKKYGYSAHFFITTDAIGKKDPYPWDDWFRGEEHLSSPEKVGMDLMPLSAHDIKKLVDEGATIGSHSHRHVFMTNFNRDELMSDVQKSKDILEEISGMKIDTIAYPIGRFDQVVVDTLKQTGYKWAFSVKSGRIKPWSRFNPYILYRNSTLNHISLQVFQQILDGGYDFLRIREKFKV
jgi:peptidoglycan/xylan/chitin deacetylase (PgdA/CDA1 family)